MTLHQQQALFVQLFAKLIEWAYANGYELTWGEAWRSPETAAMYARDGRGILNSLHCSRLAVDVNLFRDGQWLTDSKAHQPLADYWKTLHPLAAWGGDFSKPDGNHYSLAWQGRK